MTETADIAIVGGGPVGAALALALVRRGLAPAVLESREPEHHADDPRPLALSHGSRLILDRLGAWDRLGDAAPIRRIHVSQRGGFGRVELTAREAGLPALGYVVDYGTLHRVLSAALAGCGARVLGGARVAAVKPGEQAAVVEFSHDGAEKSLAARLVAVADGGRLRNVSNARLVDYGQTAITALVESELPHRDTAFERFTAGGPLALLPYDRRMALIWTVASEQASELCGLPAAAFLARLRQQFGGRLGSFVAATPRTAYPLALRTARDIVLPHTVLIGNAAQMLHPVAGQGFNLGLRDAWELAEAVARAGADALGGAAMLAAYRARRHIDRAGGVWFTDGLVRLFSNDAAPLRAVRGAGLALLACMPPLRDFVVRRMVFGARG